MGDSPRGQKESDPTEPLTLNVKADLYTFSCILASFYF